MSVPSLNQSSGRQVTQKGLSGVSSNPMGTKYDPQAGFVGRRDGTHPARCPRASLSATLTMSRASLRRPPRLLAGAVRLRQRFVHGELAKDATDLEHTTRQAADGLNSNEVATRILPRRFALSSSRDARRVDETDAREVDGPRAVESATRVSSSCANRPATARSISPETDQDRPAFELGSLEDDVPIAHRACREAPPYAAHDSIRTTTTATSSRGSAGP